MKSRLNPTILETNVFYFIIALVLLTLGSFVQHHDINSGLLITEFEIILIPTLFYLAVKKYNLNSVLKLNKISFLQGIITPFIVIFSYPVGIFLNLIVIMILGYFGKIIQPPLPTPTSLNDFIVGLFIISLSAGICEEILFRGMILSSYERIGKIKAIFISGLMFGIFHFNIQNLVGPIFLGLLFGYIVIKTNSVFIGIIAHATNNAIAWTLSFIMSKLPFVSNNTNTDMFLDLSSKEKITSMLITLAIVGIWALFSGAIAFLLIWFLPGEKFKDIKTKNQGDIGLNEGKNKLINFLPIIIVLIIFVFINYRILSSV